MKTPEPRKYLFNYFDYLIFKKIFCFYIIHANCNEVFINKNNGIKMKQILEGQFIV